MQISFCSEYFNGCKMWCIFIKWNNKNQLPDNLFKSFKYDINVQYQIYAYMKVLTYSPFKMM